MKVKVKSFGDYKANCYVITKNNKSIIIDPGVGAMDWIVSQVNQPVAVFLTHGHFDHIWDAKKLADHFSIPIYCPKDDCFMLEEDYYQVDQPKFTADIAIDERTFELAGFAVQFLHFPGHSPGASMILIDDVLFSGDVLFKGTIGNHQLILSQPEKMKSSIAKMLKLKPNYPIYPGHGSTTTLDAERANLRLIINQL